MEDGVTETEKFELQTRNTSDGDGKVEEETKPGGIINQLISSFGSEGREEEEEEEEEEVKGKNEGGGGGGGGIVNNLISNMFRHSEGGSAVEDSEQVKAKDEGGGGGLNDNIVSHLPTPLGDYAAPAMDEASILIHSIIHD